MLSQKTHGIEATLGGRIQDLNDLCMGRGDVGTWVETNMRYASDGVLIVLLRFDSLLYIL